MKTISFKLEIFEGPLDLLMHLIQKNKVNIYDIPIAEITDQYLAYLNHMSEMDLELTSEFLVMAAHLLYIKSKMLLPKYTETEEEENDSDPRQELVDKLLEYKKYKAISKYLDERQNIYKNIAFKKPDKIEIQIDNADLKKLSVDDLIKAFNNIVIRNDRIAPPPKESFEGIIGREKISIDEKAKEILQTLTRKGRVLFLDIFKYVHSKAEIVARFLAILELIKSNQVLAIQQENSDKIYIYYSKMVR
ncbi:MAG: segregation and condensation protein [Clostridiales bacterium]|jgi:segregation and condensation protein A|nr:segregation and condensation protein [Clostridiales bacterium]MDK2932621.1 segregation and condensation protein [Clostridiales bacterium]